MLNVEFTGATVLGQGGLESRPLAIADGFIVDEVPGKAIDLAGYMILPGIIDVHGDGFERHLAPRRGAMKTFAQSARSLLSSSPICAVSYVLKRICWIFIQPSHSAWPIGGFPISCSTTICPTGAWLKASCQNAWLVKR